MRLATLAILAGLALGASCAGAETKKVNNNSSSHSEFDSKTLQGLVDAVYEHNRIWKKIRTESCERNKLPLEKLPTLLTDVSEAVEAKDYDGILQNSTFYELEDKEKELFQRNRYLIAALGLDNYVGQKITEEEERTGKKY